LLRQWGRNDYQKIQSKGSASLKLWVPIYHWKQKNVAGGRSGFFDAVETDFGFDIEIYKNIKAGAESSSAASAGAVYGINALLGTHLKPKIWYSLPCKAKTCGNAHADNVALPFGWIW
jgi:homoserine kinase